MNTVEENEIYLFVEHFSHNFICKKKKTNKVLNIQQLLRCKKY